LKFEKGFTIFIVTNANEVWVRNCLYNFFPELKEFIDEYKLLIYSAKNLYKKDYIVRKWKV